MVAGGPSPGPRARRWADWLAAGAVGAGFVMALGSLPVSSHGEEPLCLLRRWLMPCPGCGSLRSLAAVGRGNWSEAWTLHPLVPLILVEALGLWLLAGIRMAATPAMGRSHRGPKDAGGSRPPAASLVVVDALRNRLSGTPSGGRAGGLGATDTGGSSSAPRNAPVCGRVRRSGGLVVARRSEPGRASSPYRPESAASGSRLGPPGRTPRIAGLLPRRSETLDSLLLFHGALFFVVWVGRAASGALPW